MDPPSGAASDSFFKNEYPDTVSTFSQAARIGDVNKIKELLSAGRLPQVTDNRGWTAIHSCVAAKQVEALIAILEHKPKSKSYLSNLSTWEGETPLILACQNEPVPEIARILLNSGADPNKCTNEGFSPLHFACKKKGNLQLVKLLVEHGANVDAKEEMDGCTPLHFAVDEAVDDKIVEYLVGISNVNILDSGLESALFKACAGNFLEAVKLILKKSSESVNKIPLILFSPLSSAALAGNLEMVKLLLDAGADVHFKGRAGIHRHCLYQKEFLPIHSSLINVDVFKILLNKTDPAALQPSDRSNHSSNFPIYVMFYAPNTEFFEILMQHDFTDEYRDLKVAKFSNLTDFILHSRDFTQDKILQKFQLFFKYYSHFEPENVFEHFTCLMSNDELIKKHRFLNLLAKMGISWTDSVSSKLWVIRLLSNPGEISYKKEHLEETIIKLKEPVLTLKQLSRVIARRYIRSRVEDDWAAYKMIKESCLPVFLKNYLWYQILD